MNEKKLKVVIIVGDLYPDDLGGAEVHIVEVIRGLARRGHTLHVFVGESLESKRLFSFPNVHLHAITYPKIKNLYSLSYIFWGIPKIAQFLEKNKIDLLHAKEVFPMGIMAANLKKKFKIPVYLTIQNPVAYKEELVVKGNALICWIGNIAREGLVPWIHHALKKADVVAAVSHYSAGGARPYVCNRLEIVPNGVDTEKFYPSKKSESEKFPRKKRIISTTSTLIPRNGIDILIRGFAQLAKKHPNTELHIAGEGPLKKELVQWVHRLKIEDAVKFLGTVPHDKVPDLLQKSFLFVRPSRVEGFGVSFIEAMACGVPVITCPSGGILDFVKDGETGLLIPQDNPEALFRAMDRAIQDPKLVQKLVENGLKCVKERYNWTAIVDRVEELYFRVINNLP